MKGKAEYIKYFLSNAPWVVYQRLTKKRKNYKKFCGHKLSMSATNSALKMAIISGKPFSAIRFGAVELSCLNNHEKIELGFASTYKQSVRYSMKNNAGFYPTDDKHLKEYGDILLQALSRIDFLGTSGAHMENYFYAKYCPQAEPLVYEGFEPLRGDWVSALYGKKVLVVSPFSSEIEFQYNRKDKLFAGHPEMCPDFELITLTAPLTCADAKPAVFLPLFGAIGGGDGAHRLRRDALRRRGLWPVPLPKSQVAREASHPNRWGYSNPFRDTW